MNETTSYSCTIIYPSAPGVSYLSLETRPLPPQRSVHPERTERCGGSGLVSRLVLPGQA